MTQAHDLTLTQARDAIAERTFSAEELTRALVERASGVGMGAGAGVGLNCFLEVFADAALEQAREIDARLGRGEDVGPLGGVPVALKDNLCLEGALTTCASRILEGYRSPFTGTAVQKLLDAGAIPFARTNMDEFAMGSSGEHSVAGPTRNPWDPERVPGGSSAGSAAAVAARLVPAALGSDTGGSIRQPAGYCGIVGLKPTYSRVSRYGLVAFASSLDQIGPLTRTVEDAALVLNVIAGHDPRDSTSSDLPETDFGLQLEEPIAGLRIGVVREALEHGNDPSVLAAFNAAIETFRGLGAEIVDVHLPHLEHAIAAYYIIAPAEASSNLARFDGVRYGRRAALEPGDTLIDLYAKSRAEGFGPEVQRRIMLGTYALSSGYYDAYYVTALKARRLIKGDFDAVFGGDGPGANGVGGCHAIIMPTTPTPAFRLGEKLDDPLAMYLEDVYTVPANMAGLPAISVPMGSATSDDGRRLPLGLQIYAPAFEEARLLRIARMFERATGFGDVAPVFGAS